MKFLKVPRGEGEKVRRLLVEKGLFAHGYKVLLEGDFIMFPVKAGLGGYVLADRDAEKLPEKHVRLKDLLSKHLSDGEMDSLTTSYDIVGDIIIAEIPPGMEEKENLIADALLKVNPAAKVVAKKLGPMEGEFRVRRIKVIGGEQRTETVHKEHGCRMKLDVAKVYFSVRLSTERKRISGLVQPGERILALFAGVGPFPLVIARSHPDAEIVAIELNPEAVRYMEENVRLNRMPNIKPVLGDAREVVLRDYRGFADRVLMPLPKSAAEFLDVAMAGAKDGGMIHFYAFDSEGTTFPEAERRVAEAAGKAGLRAEIVGRRVVRPYSPGVVQVAIDFQVHSNRL